LTDRPLMSSEAAALVKAATEVALAGDWARDSSSAG
jgi:hypothetical protein